MHIRLLVDHIGYTSLRRLLWLLYHVWWRLLFHASIPEGHALLLLVQLGLSEWVGRWGDHVGELTSKADIDLWELSHCLVLVLVRQFRNR